MSQKKMEEIKSKFFDLINKQNRIAKIPSMGFSDYFVNSVTTNHPNSEAPKGISTYNRDDLMRRLPDQEILDGIESIYFQENENIEDFELRKFSETKLDYGTVEHAMMLLKQQHKVISKTVLQNILEQTSACNTECEQINETAQQLGNLLINCRSARSTLSIAQKTLTTTNLDILATYKKREIMQKLLKTLHTIKQLKSTENKLQKLLAGDNYSDAITLLLECKKIANENSQYKCVEALSQKIQDTMLLTELQLDSAFNEMTQNFDAKKYSKLQEAQKLLGKNVIAIDQLHINFISAIHTTAFTVLKTYVDNDNVSFDKETFEEMSQNIPTDKYILCLIDLCKRFWTILVCYYQVLQWHQNSTYPISSNIYCEQQNNNNNNSIEVLNTENLQITNDEYIQQRLKNGQSRIWNDMQTKICLYLSSSAVLKHIKYEQFIQILSIVQRLKKVGNEFCNESSDKLLEVVREQSLIFFNRYHVTCFDEICLFLDNEAWIPVISFQNLIELQEFRFAKNLLRRQQQQQQQQQQQESVAESLNDTTNAKLPINHKKFESADDAMSVHSHEGSSIYGVSGYFYRFSEKSTPFDGGFDESMLEEDVLAGVADHESSCYFSEESEEERYMTNDTTTKSHTQTDQCNNSLTTSTTSTIQRYIVCNATLTVLRYIGKYLQISRLLNSITPNVVVALIELIEFYIIAVHEIFASDLPVPRDNIYTNDLKLNHTRVMQTIVANVKNWSTTSFSMIQIELCNPDSMYGFLQRLVGVESSIALAQFLDQLECLLPMNDRHYLRDGSKLISSYVCDLRKPIFMCVMTRIVDMQTILTAMAKVKWAIDSVNVEHSAYVQHLNRIIQSFSMRLDEVIGIVAMPTDAIWNNLAHVLTHTLVEGYANAKKCTTGGRALMQLDFAYFMSMLEMTSGLKFTSHRTYVESYIKAYYMPKDLLEEWIKQQSQTNNYSTKQLIALIQCTCVNDKRTRQLLLAIVENGSNNISS